MTLDTFLRRLKNLDHEWRLVLIEDASDCIRDKNGDCPIVAVARSAHPKRTDLTNEEPVSAADLIGLPYDGTCDLVAAADKVLPGSEKVEKLRQRLLKICKLKVQ